MPNMLQPQADQLSTADGMDELVTEMMYAASCALCLPSVDLKTVNEPKAQKVGVQLGRLLRTLERKGITPLEEKDKDKLDELTTNTIH